MMMARCFREGATCDRLHYSPRHQQANTLLLTTYGWQGRQPRWYSV